MNNDIAYLLGLIVGGGIIDRNFTSLCVNLPYKKWGQTLSDPGRAGQIAEDILLRVKPIFEAEYGLPIYYDIKPDWRIRCEGNLNNLFEDLKQYGICAPGEIRKYYTLDKILPYLGDDTLKRQFIAGLADSIGSLTSSHRRFTKDYQIVSFEFAGNNYKLVYQICRLLRQINCYPDQILWNHPNQHSSQNPYYIYWKKGFKLRVLLDMYVSKGSFFFQAKKESALQNSELQKTKQVQVLSCENRPIHITPSTIHFAENSNWLPSEIRGLHFIHHKHICAVLGCPYAPIDKLTPYLNKIEYYINPFPIISCDTWSEIQKIIESEHILCSRKYNNKDISIGFLLETYRIDQNTLIFGENGKKNGYPINKILQGIAFVLAANQGLVKGNRISGNFINVIRLVLSKDENKLLEELNILVPDKMTPIIIRAGEFGALVGPQNPIVYKKLVNRIDRLKISVRPIKEDDLDE